MSAFVVSKEHIDFLVSAGLSRQYRHGSTLRWFNDEPDESAYRAGEAIPAGSIVWAKAHGRELTEETAGFVGAMLLAENQRSVNHRYDEDDLEEPYLFREVRGPFDPVVVLKAISCFEYQACEHQEWAKSEAKQFCNALRHAAIAALPGYEDGKGWSIEADDVQYEVGINLTSLMKRRDNGSQTDLGF